MQVRDELLEDVLVGHDELFGALTVGNVAENAQRLLFDFARVFAFEDEYYGRHDLLSVLIHDVINVLL